MEVALRNLKPKANGGAPAPTNESKTALAVFSLLASVSQIWLYFLQFNLS